MKIELFLCAAPIGFLCACGGSTGIREPAAPIAIDPAGLSILDTTFEGTANGIQLGGVGKLTQGTDFKSWFVSEEHVILTVGSRTILLFFDGFNRYDDNDDLASMFFSKAPVDGVIDADVVALTYVERPSATGPQTLYNYITGVATDPSAISGFGTASYSGNGHFWGKDSAVTVATVNLDVDFSAGQISGSLTQAIPGAPSVGLTMPATDIDGTEFTGTLESNLISVTDSVVSGGFYGANAGSAAGIANANTDLGPISGYFITTR